MTRPGYPAGRFSCKMPTHGGTWNLSGCTSGFVEISGFNMLVSQERDRSQEKATTIVGSREPAFNAFDPAKMVVYGSSIFEVEGHFVVFLK